MRDDTSKRRAKIAAHLFFWVGLSVVSFGPAFFSGWRVSAAAQAIGMGGMMIAVLLQGWANGKVHFERTLLFRSHKLESDDGR